MTKTELLMDDLTSRGTTNVVPKTTIDVEGVCSSVPDYAVSGNQSKTGPSARKTKEYIPRTELGRKLMALRKKAIANGMKLLSEEEGLEEARRRRGKLEDDETDVY